jgi:5-methylcytosine-specific restriction protein A
MPGGWEGSQRKTELPDGWELRIRPAIIERDSGRCRWIQDGKRCPARGTDVDHVGDKHDHSLSNLRLLCGFHHKRRTSVQGLDAKRAKASRNAERHPALG